jgi:hypothetical protein
VVVVGGRGRRGERKGGGENKVKEKKEKW